MVTVSPDQLDSAIRQILDEYGTKATSIINEEVPKVAAKGRKKLADRTRGWGTGKYSKGWAVKKEDSFKGMFVRATIYNKTVPGLPHLLEKSHTIKNQYGTYGQTVPESHIAEINEWVAKELEARIIARINK